MAKTSISEAAEALKAVGLLQETVARHDRLIEMVIDRLRRIEGERSANPPMMPTGSA